MRRGLDFERADIGLTAADLGVPEGDVKDGYLCVGYDRARCILHEPDDRARGYLGVKAGGRETEHRAQSDST